MSEFRKNGPESGSFVDPIEPTNTLECVDDVHLASARRVIDTGRARWPEIKIPDADVFEALLPRFCTDALTENHPRDLFLATACAQGDPGALRVLESDFFSKIPVRLGRFRIDATEMEDLLQSLRTRVLSPPEPKIGSFSGRGPLAHWLHIAAVRLAINHVGTKSPDASDAAVIAQLIEADELPEISVLRREGREKVATALAEAVACLSVRQKLCCACSSLTSAVWR